MIVCRSQTLHANDIGETTYALPEKTKRGPPTNKNTPVRNMKAQITNMSLNENIGFKTEYHVCLFFFNCIFFILVVHFSEMLRMDFIDGKNIYKMYNTGHTSR